MLRQLLARGSKLQRVATGQTARYAAAASAPSVYDKMVQITVVDGTGRRFPLRGMEGQTLVQLLEEQQTPLDVGEYLTLDPDGRGQHECVVTVPNEYMRRIPPCSDDDFRALEQIAERGITPNTRRGSKITLTRDINDMLVSLSGVLPAAGTL